MSEHRMEEGQDEGYAVCKKCGLTIAKHLSWGSELRACNGRKKCAMCNWAGGPSFVRVPFGDICAACERELSEYEDQTQHGATVQLLDGSETIGGLRLPHPHDRLPDVITFADRSFRHVGGTSYQRVQRSYKVPRHVALLVLSQNATGG